MIISTSNILNPFSWGYDQSLLMGGGTIPILLVIVIVVNILPQNQAYPRVDKTLQSIIYLIVLIHVRQHGRY